MKFPLYIISLILAPPNPNPNPITFSIEKKTFPNQDVEIGTILLFLMQAKEMKEQPHVVGY